MSALFRLSLFSVAFIFLAGCASSQMKARKEQRDKAIQSAKLYCDFINGEVYPDIEVALNLEMAKRCDSNKSMSMTNYRSPSEAVGIVYCCSVKDEPKKDEPKKADPKHPDQKVGDGKADDFKLDDMKPSDAKASPDAKNAKPKTPDQKADPKKDDKP